VGLGSIGMDLIPGFMKICQLAQNLSEGAHTDEISLHKLSQDSARPCGAPIKIVVSPSICTHETTGGRINRF
jgi:hypothetical protein